MESPHFKELTLFVEKQRGKFKFPLTEKSEIENELGITGDDAAEFIIDFSKRFNIDISDFNIDNYFSSEGSGIVKEILGMFSKRPKPQIKILTLGHLEKAISAGRLDENVINNS